MKALLLATALLATASGAFGQMMHSFGSDDTPANGASGSDGMCQLSGLTFSNGLSITGFDPNTYTYSCSWASGTTSFTTVVTPTTMDPGSSAEVALNGALVNSEANNNAISNDGSAPNSPQKSSGTLTFATGSNTIIVGVSCHEMGSNCYYEYKITCNGPAPSSGSGGFVVGDPQFVGLRGQSYQVHGVSGEVYNIVSDADLQYNSRFVFLNQGACPTVDGKKQKGCWSHPGSYLGELGLKTRAGDKIKLISGPAAEGFATVEVNGQAVSEGETVLLKDGLGAVSRNSTHLASVNVGNWDFAFENSDMFVNQRVRVLDARGLRSHGLLGQTWRDVTYPNAIKYVQGQVDDYVIRDGDLFGDNFVFNTFN